MRLMHAVMHNIEAHESVKRENAVNGAGKASNEHIQLPHASSRSAAPCPPRWPTYNSMWRLLIL